MSYGLALTGDAQIDLRELQPVLQEEVLDEVERLAADPTLVKPRRPGSTAIHDLVWEHGGIRHYVFLTVDRDEPRRLIRVLGIAHFERVA